MSLIEKWKLRKIKKLRASSDSEKALEKFLKDDKWNVALRAIEALEFLGSESATVILIQHFQQLGTYNTSDAKRIIQALGKIDNPKAIGFIRHIYLDYKNNKANDYSDFAKRVLNKIGSPIVILDQINELDVRKLHNKSINDKVIETLCNKIRKHISKEEHLIQIVSETEIPEIAHEALKKIDGLNIDTIPYLKGIILRGVISKDILERIKEPKIFIDIIDEYIFGIEKEKSSLIINKLKELHIDYSINEIQLNCQCCQSKGHFIDTEILTEDQIFYGEIPKEINRKCTECDGKGKVKFKKLRIEH